MNNLVIRPLADAAEARFCGAFMAASDPWRTLGYNEELLSARLTNPAREVHIARIENQIAGVLMLHLDGPMNGYIQIIAVHPDHRQRGIGARLVSHAEERIFRQSPNAFLCVSEFNLRAQKFYERLGYRRVGEFTDYIVKGHSEFVMRKTRGPLLDFQPAA